MRQTLAGLWAIGCLAAWGQFSPQRVVDQYESPMDPFRMVSGDVDSDGILDIVVSYGGGASVDTIVWYKGAGEGVFGDKQVIWDEGCYTSDIPLVDLDGDGDLDLVSGAMDQQRLVWFRNNGSGNFGSELLIDSDAGWVRAIDTGDLDGDGDMDLVVSLVNPTRTVWYPNQGSGSFVGPWVIMGSTLSAPRIGDMNMDGALDVIVLGSFGILWYYNDGLGYFSGPIQVTANALNWYDLADLNDDGALDVVMCSSSTSSGMISWLLNNGDGQFGLPSSLACSGIFGRDVRCADLDQDGDKDIVATFAFNDKVLWFENEGAGVFTTEREVTNDPAFPFHLHLADVDGDERVDVLVGFSDTDRLSWFKNFLLSPFRIHGDLFHDENEDGVKDPDEQGLPFLQVTSSPYISSPMTDADGAYIMYVDTGSYEVSSQVSSNLWGLTTDSVTYHTMLTPATPISLDNDFGYSPIVDTTMLALSIVPSGGPCGWWSFHSLAVLNQGTTQPQGMITYVLDTLFDYVTAWPSPNYVNGDTLRWHYDSLFYFTEELIHVQVFVPVLALGTPFNCPLMVTAEDDMGTVLSSFSAAYSGILGCSYDPNDKQVSPAGYGAFGAVDIETDHLDYTIRFQNTGSAPAYSVMLRDQLSDHFDLDRLEVLAYSHLPSQILLEPGRELVIRFDNISLPDSATSQLESHGFIKFRIGLLPGLADGTLIPNEAEIYFDLNQPVLTNTTSSTLVDCSIWHPLISTIDVNVLMTTTGDAYQWYQDGIIVPGATAQFLLLGAPGTYTAEVTSVYGCTNIADPVQIIALQVPEDNALNMAVVPNPFTSETIVLFGEILSSDHPIELVDLNGRVVRSFVGTGSDQLVLSREGLPAGMYVLRVSTASGYRGAVRIVIE